MSTFLPLDLVKVKCLFSINQYTFYIDVSHLKLLCEMTTKNCVNGPKLVLKDLCEKSLLLGITAQLAFFLWNSNSSWHDFLVLSVTGVCPLSDSFRALSMHSGEISRKLEASRVSSEWLCSHSVSKEQDHLLSILTTIWKGQLLFFTLADGFKCNNFCSGSLFGLQLRVLCWHL